MVDDTESEEVESFKFLGILMDEGLTCNLNINNTCKILASNIYALRNLANLALNRY